MTTSILMAYNDSISSRAALEFLCKLPLNHEDTRLHLIHIFRKPTAGEDLMGHKFMEEQPIRLSNALQEAKDKLVAHGFPQERVEVHLLKEPYPTVTDGIIDIFLKGKYDLVVIGRKRMSKAEEFVLGDPSTKLVRALENTAVLVVKSK